MKELITRQAGRFVAKIAHTTRSDGDLSTSVVAADELAARRRSLIDLPWRSVHQVHSDRVISVRADSSAQPSAAQPIADQPRADRPIADALTTASAGLVLAVHSGDCVPVGFVHHGGAVGAAHAGWKGLQAGVLESTVRQLRAELPSSRAPITAVVGPHIRSACYEFGVDELTTLARQLGDHVIATTTAGSPSLDLTAAIAGELARLDITVDVWSPDCTATDADAYWSHRARQEAGRIALVAWLEDPDD